MRLVPVLGIYLHSKHSGSFEKLQTLSEIQGEAANHDAWRQGSNQREDFLLVQDRGSDWVFAKPPRQQPLSANLVHQHRPGNWVKAYSRGCCCGHGGFCVFDSGTVCVAEVTWGEKKKQSRRRLVEASLLSRV